jgi:hypothetical protein
MPPVQAFSSRAPASRGHLRPHPLAPRTGRPRNHPGRLTSQRPIKPDPGSAGVLPRARLRFLFRVSHSRASSPHYDRGQPPSGRLRQASEIWPQPDPPQRCPGQGWAFLDRCHPAVGETAGPGGAPAAKRGRTTWRRGEPTAILGREEGQGSRSAGEAPAPEGHLTGREEDRRTLLTQRGFVLDGRRSMSLGTRRRPDQGVLGRRLRCELVTVVLPPRACFQ